MTRGNTSSSVRPFEALEGRQLFAVTVGFVAPDTLVFTGDAQADTVRIFDNGAPLGTITGSASNAAGTLVPFAQPGVRNIIVNTMSGNDSVVYRVFGDMLAGTFRRVTANLGEGQDFLRADLAADIDIGANTFVDVRAYGQGGADYLSSVYRGEMDGRLFQHLDGGSGNDILFADTRIDAGSTGQAGIKALGGTENDRATVVVRKANPLDPVLVASVTSGGTGTDTLTKTMLVANDLTWEGVSVVL